MKDVTIEAVLDYLRSIHELSEGCLEHLRRVIQKRVIDKGEILLKIGDVNENLYFIVSGAIHCFYYVRRKPVSAWFFFQGETVVSIGSFYDQVPSEDCMVALEPSLLLYINKAEYEYLKGTFLEFSYVALTLMERYLKIFSEHPRFIRKHVAAERYQLVLARDPELVNRVPVNALASWLGINENTLSRIRGSIQKALRIAKKGKSGLKKGI